ncbi:FAD-dependent monooxygenase [Lutibacter aestuarii]|uniref:FAD-dependent monooxygenase n=1 Tax=Lutibacter aestuarii TaxID=861111 RepID=A0ABW2Z5D9_9FLAO|nr:FAD-dependent monooxygenase [uncultured Lutibacter sp.]
MKNISIIGGGIGGLTTALCFEKLGIEYTLYEKVNKLKTVGAGIWLSPNALQVLEWINPSLLHSIQRSGNSFNKILLTNHKLQPIRDSSQDFVKDMFGYTTLAIHRGVLQKILYSFINNKANIQLNKGFESYFQNSDHSYTINFHDQSTQITNVIIGADGINSKVRQQIFPKSKLRYSGQTCWRGVADFELDNNLVSAGFTLWGKKLQFGVSKLENGKTYWFAVMLSEPNLQENRETVKTKLIELFSQHHPIVTTLIQNTSANKIIRGDLSDLEWMNKWHTNTICLIGDAAHAMTPDLGQGGAQAMEDAFYLSNLIHQSNAFDVAFNNFYNLRKTKVKKLVEQSRLTSKMAITNKPLELLRNIILKYSPEKVLQKQMIETYTIDKTICGV